MICLSTPHACMKRNAQPSPFCTQSPRRIGSPAVSRPTPHAFAHLTCQTSTVHVLVHANAGSKVLRCGAVWFRKFCCVLQLPYSGSMWFPISSGREACSAEQASQNKHRVFADQEREEASCVYSKREDQHNCLFANRSAYVYPQDCDIDSQSSFGMFGAGQSR